MDSSARSEIATSSLASDFPRNVQSTITIENKIWEISTALPNKKGKTFWVWNHGLKLSDPSDPAKSAKFWMCKPCHLVGKQVLYSTGTTSHSREHLRKEHHLSEESSSTLVPDEEPTTEHEFDLEEFKRF
jgi:hypothetical protein